MCPQKLKIGDELLTPANPATSGTQNAGEPKAYEGGQRGPRGAKPPWRGIMGVSPHNTKEGRVANPCNPATSGAQNSGEPAAHEGGQTGGPGGGAPWQGVWGMCPQELKRRGE